jgi:hypothetical protein
MATSPSKKKPEAKKAPVAPTKKMRPEDTMSEKDKAYFRRKMQEEEMMRKMGQRYDEICQIACPILNSLWAAWLRRR